MLAGVSQKKEKLHMGVAVHTALEWISRIGPEFFLRKMEDE